MACSFGFPSTCLVPRMIQDTLDAMPVVAFQLLHAEKQIFWYTNKQNSNLRLKRAKIGLLRPGFWLPKYLSCPQDDSRHLRRVTGTMTSARQLKIGLKSLKNGVFRPFFAENCVFTEIFWCNYQKIFGSECTLEPPGPIPGGSRPHFQHFYLSTKIALEASDLRNPETSPLLLLGAN